MIMENYEQQLDDLRAGKIDHFEITPEQFQAFQRVYHAYPYRTQIEGKANIGGKITYHLRQRWWIYQKDEFNLSWSCI